MSDEADEVDDEGLDELLARAARDNAVYITLRALLAALDSREETAGVVAAAKVIAQGTAADVLASFSDQPHVGQVTALLREAVDDMFTFPDGQPDGLDGNGG